MAALKDLSLSLTHTHTDALSRTPLKYWPRRRPIITAKSNKQYFQLWELFTPWRCRHRRRRRFQHQHFRLKSRSLDAPIALGRQPPQHGRRGPLPTFLAEITTKADVTAKNKKKEVVKKLWRRRFFGAKWPTTNSGKRRLEVKRTQLFEPESSPCRFTQTKPRSINTKCQGAFL